MDWIAVVLSLIGSYFIAVKKVIAYPIFLIGNTFWILFYMKNDIYSAILLNIIYSVINVYGWYQWKKDEN
jgi:nicotinamide mononucleotide transporter